MRRAWILIPLAVVVAMSSACLHETAWEGAGGRLRVTATVGMVADTVKIVGGDRVAVAALMGPGVDPHLFKASARDVVRLRSADLVFYVGLHLEGKMSTILSKLGDKAFAAGEALDPDRLIALPGHEGAHDPHIWFDVGIWAATVGPVAERLSEADPEGREYYEANAAAYRQKLLALDEEIKQTMARIPEERRVLVSAHDAFSYFGKAYNIEVVGLKGISTAAEFGVSDRSRVVDLIVSRGIKAIFVESSMPRQSIDAVVDDCRQLGREVEIGGQLFSDAMGEEGTPEGTYIGMVRSNVEKIYSALK